MSQDHSINYTKLLNLLTVEIQILQRFNLLLCKFSRKSNEGSYPSFWDHRQKCIKVLFYCYKYNSNRYMTFTLYVLRDVL